MRNHKPTLSKLIKSCSIRRDSGDFVEITDGHILLSIPDYLWPTDLARFNTRGPRPVNAKPLRPIKTALEPCDLADLPHLDVVIPYPLHSEPDAQQIFNSTFEERPIQSVLLGEYSAVPLAAPDSTIYVNKLYFDAVRALDLTFAAPVKNNSATLIMDGTRLVGVLMPLQS